MRMSCNGCRVLRKGCSDACSIRPCLQWIKDPESQANATVFLAKFYGRAGLINLINAAAPDNLRPAIFRSLLYEACGRIVNPTYGSVGLLWSGSWQMCQAAVEAVLNGKPIVQIPSDASPPPFNGYDIRHVTRVASADLHKVTKPTTGRTRFKRSAHHAAAKASQADCQTRRAQSIRRESSSEDESLFSEETAEASHVSQAVPGGREEGEVELELTLGFEPARPAVRTEPERRRVEMDGSDDDKCEMELGLELKS